MCTVKAATLAVALLFIYKCFTSLALLVIFPIPLTLFLFGLFLNPAGLPVPDANVFLMVANIKAYKPLLKV